MVLTIKIHSPETGWWLKHNLEKYEFVNGKDDIPYMKWKRKHVPNHQPAFVIASVWGNRKS